MSKRFKRLLACLLAVGMICSLNLTAFAAESTKTNDPAAAGTIAIAATDVELTQQDGTQDAVITVYMDKNIGMASGNVQYSASDESVTILAPSAEKDQLFWDEANASTSCVNFASTKNRHMKYYSECDGYWLAKIPVKVNTAAAGTHTVNFKFSVIANANGEDYSYNSEAAATIRVQAPVTGYVASIEASEITDNKVTGTKFNVEILGSWKGADAKNIASGQVAFTYPAEYMTLKDITCTNSAAKVDFDDKNGSVALTQFGGEAATTGYTASFTAIKAGKNLEIKLKNAGFNTSDSSSTEDIIPAVLDPAVLTIEIVGTPVDVTLCEGLTGEEKALVDDSYTFEQAEDAQYRDYSAMTVTMNGETLTAGTDYSYDAESGTYTIAKVTGAITVAGVTGKTYQVTAPIRGTTETLDVPATAVYGTDYTFTLPEATNKVVYRIASITIGGEDYTPSTTISGNAIKGDIVINIEKSTVAIEVEGGDGDVTVPDDYEMGQDTTITIDKKPGYDYVVKVGDTVIEPNDDGTYTIPGELMHGNVKVTVEKTVSKDGLTVAEYVTLDGASAWLVLNSTNPGSGKVPTYDGNNMFWSEKYDSFCYLVISAESQTKVEEAAAAALGIADGTAISVDYGMDVNKTGKVDANDAQLTYNIYKPIYSDFSKVSMEKWLRADVNADKTVSTLDATAIIHNILGIE